MTQVRQKKIIYEFCSFRLDAVNRVLFQEGKPLVLAPKAMDILIVLVENSDRIVEKSELMKLIWPEVFVEEINLTVHISSLRKILKDSPNNPMYIATVPKLGYRFVATVNHFEDRIKEPNDALMVGGEIELSELAMGNLELTEVEERSSSFAHSRLRLSPRPVNSLAFLVVLVALIPLIWFSNTLKEPVANTQANSVAVLPFKPLYLRTGEEIGVGMADALITKLSNIEKITVRPTTSILKYDLSEQSIQDIGQELQVDSVLCGYIQHSGNNIRVTMQLIKVREGKSFWAATFEENSTDIFKLQETICGRASEVLANLLINKRNN